MKIDNIDEIYDIDFYEYIKRFCHSRISFTNYDGEDAVQEAIIKILLNQHKYDDNRNCSFRTWACAVAKNHCLDFLQAKKRRDKFLVNLEALPGYVAEGISSKKFICESTHSAGEEVKNDRLKDLSIYLDNLNDLERKVVLSRYEHGLKKTSKILGIKYASARKIFSRAVIKLKKMHGSHKAKKPKLLSMDVGSIVSGKTEVKVLKKSIASKHKLEEQDREIKIKQVELILQNYDWS